jgi:hypothetical protein
MTEENADIQTKRRQPPPSSHGREPVRAKRPAPPFLRPKPRGEWTPERVKLLATMWGRGDRTVDIAAALKCSPEAVSVARAYFRLAPRRLLPGRPKVIDDEPRHKIERVAFITSRLAEFCTEDELTKQTDHPASEWSLVVFKEATDNSLDACEEADIAPVIHISITEQDDKKVRLSPRRRGQKDMPRAGARIVIEDNGPGVPPEIIKSVTNYSVKVSSREAYISPTRGAQGNALKTLLAMAYVLSKKNGDDRPEGKTWIEAHGIKHQVMFTVDQLQGGGTPQVAITTKPSRVTSGTKLTIFWPESVEDYTGTYARIEQLLQDYCWINPHLSLTLRIDGKIVIDHKASMPSWTKYRACDATSAHWYTSGQFERYAAALIDRDRTQPRPDGHKITVREFISQFRGMSATAKQKAVLTEIEAPYMSLERFWGNSHKVNHARLAALLNSLKQHTRPMRPELLGIIGAEHMRRMILEADGHPETFKYFAFPDYNDRGLPQVVEIAIAVHIKGVKRQPYAPKRRMITGINFSATINDPFTSLRGLGSVAEHLVDLRAGPEKPVIVCVHLTCPHIVYLSRGKSKIQLR